MVSWKTNRRKTIKHITRVLFFVILAIITAVITILVEKQINNQDTKPEPEEIIQNEKQPKIEEPKIKEIDFQPVIDEWVNSIGGSKSVQIYDLELKAIVGQYNTEEKFSMASLYKLFVVYEGYRRIENKTWQENTKVGNTNHTIIECLDLAIRESNSECAEPLWRIIGQAELQNIIETEYGITETNLINLTSNVKDITKMLQLFYAHPDVHSETLINRMEDSFLNQPITTYNWRQGLPSGFNIAKVYNKVGWDYNPDAKKWNIYNDAAIIKFTDQKRDFIVVIMTNNVNYQDITKLGNMIEQKFLSMY